MTAHARTLDTYSDAHHIRVLCITDSNLWDIPGAFTTREPEAAPVQLEHVDAARLSDYIADQQEAPAIGIVAAASGSAALAIAHALRQRRDLDRMRLYIVGDHQLPGDAWILLDIEDVLGRADVSSEQRLGDVITRGISAWRALGDNPLLPKYYLDARYNNVFDWFENTRWDWREIDLDQIQPALLTEEEIAVLEESAIIEFGTLPGAHNFLREWSDEYSFSSWALAWGAEEARHSLVQSRYLRKLGIETLAKHAMYKRAPYPIGHNRAATLMMNVISECRAAEYYRTLAAMTREPVLQKIWKLLGHDESRHARAFVLFCRELCDIDQENLIASLEMAYVYLADRDQGVKHPAGFFYPHATSTKGLRLMERHLQETRGESVTDRADRRVIAILRSLTGDESLRDVSGIRRTLRELM